MVLSSVDAARQTYRLWRPFSMPTDNGAQWAVSVTTSVANNLNSAYTFMIQIIVINLWALVILAGLTAFLKEKHSHNSGVISTGIWNSRGSPFDVFRLTSAYSFKVKDHRRWLFLLWAIVAIGVCVASYAIPIVVAPYIFISTAAPVSSDAIYVPSLRYVVNDADLVKTYALEVPSALRAAGSAQVANADTRAKVFVSQPMVLQKLAGGETVLRIDYHYSITGADFGLQKYPDLILDVQGSCQTDYAWLIAQSQDSSGYIEDEYLPFDDPSFPTQNASRYDGSSPLGYFIPGNLSPTGPSSNWTWGAVVSSVQRLSFSASTDPWYLTVPSGEDGFFTVKGGRPALSCWENDVWSYHGHNSTILGLNSTALPGLDLSPALQRLFSRFLSQPKLPIVALRLGASALTSPETALGPIFDAGTSSVHADLQRLVLASYIATMNTLTDTTLFPTDHLGIFNDVLGSDGQVQAGVDEFVVWSSQIATLSIRALVVIPIVTLVMFLIVYCLTTLPSPWYRIQALQATVLYSCLHQRTLGGPDTELQHAGDTPYLFPDDELQARFRPRFDKHHRTLSWGHSEYDSLFLCLSFPKFCSPIFLSLTILKLIFVLLLMANVNVHPQTSGSDCRSCPNTHVADHGTATKIQ